MGTGGARGLVRCPLLFLSSQASLCGQLVWPSSQHGSLGIVGQLPWQQMSSRSSGPASKRDKLSYDLAFEVTFAIGQFEEYQSHFVGRARQWETLLRPSSENLICHMDRL